MKQHGDKLLVQVNDHQSVVSMDSNEIVKKQVEGDEIMILSLMRQTERLSVSNMSM